MFGVVLLILLHSPTIASFNHIMNGGHHISYLDVTDYPSNCGFPSNVHGYEQYYDIKTINYDTNIYIQFFIIFSIIWYLLSSSITSSTKISVVLILLFYHPSHAANFMLGATTLPRTTSGMAVGYDSANDTILLLGGSGDNHQQFITFDGRKFEDEGLYYMTSVLNTNGVYGTGQFYSQLGDTLWMISEDGLGFVTMDTNSWRVNIPSIDIPIEVRDDGCLASMKNSYQHEYLFVVGGYNGDYLRITQIYNISADLWIESVPTMYPGYSSRSCIIYNNTLYVMGGYKGSSSSDRDNQVWRLDVGNDLVNITNKKWLTIDQTGYRLGKSVSGPRAVVFDNYPYIFVVGGTGICCVSDIYGYNVIDTATNQVTWNTIGGLIEPVGSTGGAIVVHNILYIFHGDKWQYIIGPTSNPSPSPSIAPTNSTNNPTFVPSNSPSDFTNIPTFVPSNTPLNPSSNVGSNTSLSPTNIPSNDPSNAPTAAPSYPPTGSPSYSPSALPTLSPSQSPIAIPSSAPTSAPTRYPTIRDAYDSCINVTFGLQYLSMANIQTITSNAKQTVNDIERVTERGFIDQDAILIGYRDFWCKINSVNGNKINDINDSLTERFDEANMLSMKSVIECNNAECKHILKKYDEIELEYFVTQQLRSYFNETTNPSLKFIVIDISDQPIYCHIGTVSDHPSKIPTQTPIKFEKPSISPTTMNPASISPTTIHPTISISP
eukprot:38485_1